jgi:hypothetical protein
MRVANAVRIRRTLFAAISSNLTRRAKHLHIEIIGKSYGPAREIAAGFFVGEILVQHPWHRSDDAVSNFLLHMMLTLFPLCSAFCEAPESESNPLPISR